LLCQTYHYYYQIIIILYLLLSINSNAAQQTLKALAESHKKYIGFLVNPTHLTTEAEYPKIADREFDSFTPGNPMKWDTTEPSRGNFNFKSADIIVNHGQQHGQKIRGHTLVWHNQLPSWVSNGNFNATELRSVMQNHISHEAGHWKGKIYAWDVVNEALLENGTFRNDVFYKTLGKSYIADAFKFAHEADPAAKLYLNDYNVEGINNKSTAMYDLIKELKSQNVPIHGAGLQAHFSVGQVPTDIQKNIERFVALDVDVAITELDIRIKMPADAAKLEQQAKDYGAVVKACMAVQRCVGVTISGLTDKFSWIPSTFPGYGAALIYDENYKEKPAYNAVKDALA
jgi:endo-1,4-beta-xylanase